jgi:hypothetical protein
MAIEERMRQLLNAVDEEHRQKSNAAPRLTKPASWLDGKPEAAISKCSGLYGRIKKGKT